MLEIAACRIVSVLELENEENRFDWDKSVPSRGMVVVEIHRWSRAFHDRISSSYFTSSISAGRQVLSKRYSRAGECL